MQQFGTSDPMASARRQHDPTNPEARHQTAIVNGDDPDLVRRPPMSVPLGNPGPAFAFLALWLEPLRILRHLILPWVLLALYSAAFNWYDLSAHLTRVASTLAFWQNMLLGLLTVNLFGKISQGIAMARNGLLSEVIGFQLAFGFLPRFFIDKSGLPALSFPAQRECYAAPLLLRLMFFAAGITTWTMLLRTGSGVADAAVALAGVGFSSFLFIANPLWRADGYRWLTAYLERPKLRGQAFSVLSLVLRFKPIPEGLPRSEFWLLLLYAVATLAWTTFVIWMIVTTLAYMLEAQFRGNGVVIFCLLLASALAYLVARTQKKRAKTTRRQVGKRQDAS
jgi:hypothetical protein